MIQKWNINVKALPLYNVFTFTEVDYRYSTLFKFSQKLLNPTELCKMHVFSCSKKYWNKALYPLKSEMLFNAELRKRNSLIMGKKVD